MNRIFKAVLFFVILLSANAGYGQSVIERNSFFTAMSSNSVRLMDAQLNSLKNASGTDKGAFEGAMLMRKSGTLAVPAKKLAMFKQGHKKLEAAISKEPGNAEYRFLRLIVQENAPRTLGYYKSISQDSKFIKDNFRTLNVATQSSVTGYSKKSKALAGAF